MVNKINNINWEKSGFYIALCATFLTVIIYLMSIKDDIASIRERIAVIEHKTKQL